MFLAYVSKVCLRNLGGVLAFFVDCSWWVVGLEGKAGKFLGERVNVVVVAVEWG